MHPLNCWREVTKHSILKHIAASTATETENWEAAYMYHSRQSNRNRNWIERQTTREIDQKNSEKGQTSPGETAVPIFARQSRCVQKTQHDSTLYNQANLVEYNTGLSKRSTKEKIVENKRTGKACQHYVPLKVGAISKDLKTPNYLNIIY